MLFIIIGLSVSSCQGANGASGVGVSFPEKPQPPCTTPKHKSGDAYGSIQSAGLKRTFLLHLPPSYGLHPQALVVAYHGYSWSAAQMEHTSHLDSEGDKVGFVLALPQGVDDPPSWNAGVGAFGPTGDADDVQFTRDLLTYLSKNYCVDMQRVYITGFSLGSGMAYRIACTLTNQIAAVATVSGAYYSAGGCNATRALPVMEIHGFADPSAPYDGWPERKMIGVPEYLHLWQQIDQCSTNSRVILRTNEVTGTQWSQCAAHTEVVHYRIEHGVHSWPNPSVLDADKIIWQFFQQFSL
jgi:polyhydroxybutyrate depolymerase